MGAGERPQFEPAIVAPGAAVEADHEWSLRQERVEIDEVALGVGQEEAGTLAANGRNAVRSGIWPDALDQPVIGHFEVRKQLARCAEIEAQPLVEGTLECIRLAEGFGQGRFQRFLLVQLSLQNLRCFARAARRCTILSTSCGGVTIPQGAVLHGEVEAAGISAKARSNGAAETCTSPLKGWSKTMPSNRAIATRTASDAVMSTCAARFVEPKKAG